MIDQEEPQLTREKINRFFKLYTDPEYPDTFKNANNAAIIAGIPAKYRKNIFNQDWYITGYGEYKRELFNTLADEAIHETLTLETSQPIMDRETGEIIGYKRDAQLQAVKFKASQFIKENLDREHYGKRIRVDNTHKIEGIFSKLKAIETGEIQGLLSDYNTRAND